MSVSIKEPKKLNAFVLELLINKKERLSAVYVSHDESPASRANLSFQNLCLIANPNSSDH